MEQYYLPFDADFFPHPSLALKPNGELIAGGNLAPETMLLAYRFGIFPWHTFDGTPMWYAPDPRMVLFPEKLKVSKSMRPYFNQQKYAWSLNQDFGGVISACREQMRHDQDGSWIDDHIQSAFLNLHELGHAHSVEVWLDDELVGGLYGLHIGEVFFGESMFSRANNASKFGFISFLRSNRLPIKMVDCQQETQHMASLGGEILTGEAFRSLLRKWTWK